MREILFRGRTTYTKVWTEGGFHSRFERAFIIGISKELRIDGIEVDPETVGQFTGLTDKNGKKIFEGDIVRDLDNYLIHKGYFERGLKGEENYEKYRLNAKIGVVSFSDDLGSCGCCYPVFHGSGFKAGEVDLMVCEVIGNIHENPELMEVSNFV